jgi:hypothetical protein
MNRSIYVAVACLVAAPAFAVPIVDPYYAGSYSFVNLGSAPGVSTNYGGLVFKPGNPNTLFLGGAANSNVGVIDALTVTRDSGGHVNGFSGTASQFALAPFIDGGLSYGPGNVLFVTGYPNNTILQFLPGSGSPDKTTTAPIGSSVGAVAIVPAGYPGAGNLAIASYNSNLFCLAPIAPDGSGTFNIGGCGTITSISGGPEGILYVPLGSPLFPNPSILVAEYSYGNIASYELDASGNPIVGTRRIFISGLTGAEGAALDPTNNDFLFSTFGGANQVIRVTGFAAPVSDTPEPATAGLLGLSLAGLLWGRRFRLPMA